MLVFNECKLHKEKRFIVVLGNHLHINLRLTFPQCELMGAYLYTKCVDHDRRKVRDSM